MKALNIGDGESVYFDIVVQLLQNGYIDQPICSSLCSFLNYSVIVQRYQSIQMLSKKRHYNEINVKLESVE